MQTNITELRREAYRLWGIGRQAVVFDFPDGKHNPSNEFRFKLDFGEDKASWPRAYAIAENVNSAPLVRVILPIIMIRQYATFSLETKAWYDMPIKVHEQIIRLVNETQIVRPISVLWKLANIFLPKKYRKQKQVLVEDYTYVVSRYNEETMVWVY